MSKPNEHKTANPITPASDYREHDPENTPVLYANPQLTPALVPNTANSWPLYLLPDQDNFAEVVIDGEPFEITLQDAVTDGYLYGLHRLRAVEPIMFAPSGRGLLEYMVTDIHIVKEAYYLPQFDKAEDYLHSDIPPVTADELTDAFICGYLLAHHKAGRYGTYLFTEGECQKNQIIADLSSYESKAISALYAQERIASRLRAAKPCPTDKINDDGELVDQDGNPIDEPAKA